MAMEPKDVRTKLGAKQESNKEIFMRIYRQGKTIDPMAMMMLKLEVLVQCIMDDDSRNLFELAFEVELEKMLKEVEIQVNASKLIVPGS